MKKVIVIFTLCLGMFSFGQSQRFIYEYRFIPDSTDVQNVKNEVMYLDVDKKGSKFYSFDRADSEKKAMEDAQKSEGFGKATELKGEVSTVVEKSYPSYSTVFFNRLNNDINMYKVTDDRKLNWKILPEKEKIGEFTAQKASLDFGGRKWTAWFTTDIPIQDGPYKFKGLPGMIIKVSDQTNSHVFELKGIKKLSSDQSWISENKKGNEYQRIIAVDLKKYKKLFLEDRNNPEKMVSQPSFGNVVIVGDNGQPLKSGEQAKILKKYSDERNLKDNNIIEPDLLQ
ncbi:GLPGLI family protein [Chryseobacterium sp. JUb7]|uniref:GLPGLI family protein n=1 Tax=Chryseobacterium sp. JUb7 TaxID=2940599 RepID=UPI002167F5FD|nr:GLPGLI family protein [Chryseobacterium sp. JUb7]MCS3533142.1 GLPGLI family protein [Chryseobacterium sp. JUb7]